MEKLQNGYLDHKETNDKGWKEVQRSSLHKDAVAKLENPDIYDFNTHTHLEKLIGPQTEVDPNIYDEYTEITGNKFDALLNFSATSFKVQLQIGGKIKNITCNFEEKNSDYIRISIEGTQYIINQKGEMQPALNIGNGLQVINLLDLIHIWHVESVQYKYIFTVEKREIPADSIGTRTICSKNYIKYYKRVLKQTTKIT